MPEDRDQLPDSVLLALSQLLEQPPAEFASRLSALCARWPRLESAIRAEAEAMQRAARTRGTAPGHHAVRRAPSPIGPFQVLSEIGSGGMGTVYLAEQKAPIQRRVAIKVIKLGMDTKAVLARFEVERAALSRMEHSNIAKVLDSGTTADGRPYFVMEYVKGVPITRYCDDNRLSIEDRLALFQQVCSGVQHAHSKGVIHRDLTPNNVLVTVQDGKAAAKIIDFGLARATDNRLTEKTLFTEQGVILGTPEYMSPEQAGLGGLDIDTRSDVYTLGVMLYELLTGSLPFSQNELRAGGYDGMCRIIREREPERPSTKITKVQTDTAAIAKLRRCGSEKLLRRLRGDLDWIVLRCLDKDRTRRYETPSALAADLQRHLDDEPVEARPPSFAYRIGKLARRYRGQLTAVGLVLSATIAGLMGMTWFWLDARAQADNARRQEGIAQEKAQEALARKAEFDQLAAVVQVENALAEEDHLYPPWPDKVAAMKKWLDDVDGLMQMRPKIEATVASLRQRATPLSAEELQRDSNELEYQRLSAKIAALERAQAVRKDGEVPEVQVGVEERAMTAAQLNDMAWSRVAPYEDQRVWGDEPRGLALASLAWKRLTEEKAGTPDRAQRAEVCRTLAWAWFANGCDSRAEAAMQEALVRSQGLPGQGSMYDESLMLGDQVAAARRGKVARSVEELRARLGKLAAERAARSFNIANESERFLHATLSELLRKLEELMARRRLLAERLRWADRLGELTVHHPRAPQTWDAARAAIAKADGVVASTLYQEHPIELLPQPGLIPIGMNPLTKLWEFYDLRSAWDGGSDPATLGVPRHVLAGDRAGNIDVADDTGIVFVLLPGGAFRMGEKREERRVTLSPFFLARHELTRGQWQRLAGGLPAPTARELRRKTPPMANPISEVDWTETERLFQRHGLVLPTEAQWEYGCRAGASTELFCDAAELTEYANVSSESGSAGIEESTISLLLQGVGSRPRDLVRVGTLRPNGFGLHDVIGNVAEWTRDGCEEREYRARATRHGDGLQGDPAGFSLRVIRGGDCWSRAVSRLRDERHPSLGDERLGVRPARAIQR